VTLADQLQGFGERAKLLEIIEHAVGQLLHAADDLIGEEEDHGEAPELMAPESASEPGARPGQQTAQRRHAMKLRITIRRCARRRDAFISSTRKWEMKRRSIALAKGAHQIGIGDGVDQRPVEVEIRWRALSTRRRSAWRAR